MSGKHVDHSRHVDNYRPKRLSEIAPAKHAAELEEEDA